MDTDTVELVCNYGELKTGIEYPVQEEGCDWMKLRVHGTNFYVPKTIVKAFQPVRRYVRERLPTYEEILAEEEELFV